MKDYKISIGSVAALMVLCAGLVGAEMMQQPQPSTGAGTGTGPASQVQVTVDTQQTAAPIPITARAGDRIAITLASNRTTGYQWKLASQPAPSVVLFQSSTYNEPSEAVPGRGGTETWTFKAAGKGKSSFILNYIRPWEKDTPPVQTQKFAITVQ